MSQIRSVKKATNIYKQNPLCKGYFIVSESTDVLQSVYYESPPGYNFVNWFVNEVLKLENKMNIFFRNSKKDIVMTQEDEKQYRNSVFFCFVRKILDLTKWKIIVIWQLDIKAQLIKIVITTFSRNKVVFFTFAFHIFSKKDCRLFFKNLQDMKKDKVNLDIIHKSNEENISATNAFFRFLDSCRYLTSSLDSLVKTLVEGNHKSLTILKKNDGDYFSDGTKPSRTSDILRIIDEIEALISRNRYGNDPLEYLKKDSLEEIEKLEKLHLFRYLRMILNF